MKVLYVSDLDGTLLRSNQKTSEYTNETINRLVEKGLLFSYATARSYITARKVTEGLNARIPLILYNGTFVIDNETNEIIISNYLDNSGELLDDLIYNKIHPIVYSRINAAEKFSYVESMCSKGAKNFVESRKGDIRDNPVSDLNSLYSGDIFYITCIDEESKLKPMYEKYKDKYHCIFSKDIYTGKQWLEIMPEKVSKSSAIMQLKTYLGCDKVIAFGDGKNDVDMFKAADACYAVENADDELKCIATEVIGSNDSDAVAKWLAENALK